MVPTNPPPKPTFKNRNLQLIHGSVLSRNSQSNVRIIIVNNHHHQTDRLNFQHCTCADQNATRPFFICREGADGWYACMLCNHSRIRWPGIKIGLHNQPRRTRVERDSIKSDRLDSADLLYISIVKRHSAHLSNSS